MTNRVLLTFDFDAISLWLMRGITSPGPVSRGEFGVVGTKRILDLLDKHEIQSTFFIPGHTAETYPESVKEIAARGHEIGLHGYCHEPVSTLTREEERAIVFRAKDIIEKMTGLTPTGYRTPSADFTVNTIDILLEAELEYDSSLMGDDYSLYWARSGDVASFDQAYVFGEETSLAELPISWTLDDYPYLEWVRQKETVAPGLRRPDEMFANFEDDITYMVENYADGTTTIMFHPQVIGRGHRMLAFDRFIETVAEKGVKFDTCANAVADFKASQASTSATEAQLNAE